MNNELITEKLKEHDKILDRHDNSIEDLKTKTAVSTERTDNLCKSLDGLCSKIQMQNGIILTGIVTLIIYIIQKAIFKS
ncbi:hypothetical protein CLOBY_18300 [Clostridium saccharobutylicum]|uniref:hemolysin XhlA family protein n=1 Tax=Clostridium saccharobutylicum TaxID=169679 RepID=UPI000983FDFE|nr:hemolysin XhlA family protein [Clostridium saccharobutylicum]AQS09699.1 hypothetical protein CLOBY_18300 [Clostridium saccharobutylicum]MBC2436907.1 hypothetical protein [Clostridium saccharobutylicum]NSB89255.1 hypothetical protein [Clostridium saccharobutylicum]NYC27909.1 hypothetical protein [Clostridium saccharobutylicum]OOM17106.1 hypothetical protein CLSAB_20540 [Clostridium saccharobutylicum]